MTDSKFAIETGNASAADSNYSFSMGISNNNSWATYDQKISRSLSSNDGQYRTVEVSLNGTPHSVSTAFQPGQTYGMVGAIVSSANANRGLGVINSQASALSDFAGWNYDIPGVYPQGRTIFYQSSFRVSFQVVGHAVNCDGPYYDVYSNNQFATEIRWMRNNNIAPADANGNYRPYEATTRSDMVYFMWAMRGFPALNSGTNCFADVNYFTPNGDVICWAKAVGLVGGWPDNSFRPNQPVARDAMAAFLYRLAGNPHYVAPSSSPFTDVTPQTQFYKEMSWLRSRGISTGWPDGTYRPLSSTNRDAMAAFLYRMRMSNIA
ncbi:S-layer homology domain-containing protein [Litorihabitans aurantiacus]|uniref:SLH domain-containing protein n=1 Tax=Litorihabitans aurantiacus TaxID=1930061 RepID=A0AA38CWV5_9MICO|nr:S-layer homology domain-containing protein [Litorihabitans aurantiacus]GMA33648.1 hypothetical protein GCM10025875_36400 [Litorihabitans aurantiacus]GMA33715.1 hypothetical protein GCM10025875_37070 [Litorihabitans aurantiacus]GMA33779.1 hypothetical protein GCM10025875_37710 [Litorihabitans aurantiacus]